MREVRFGVMRGGVGGGGEGEVGKVFSRGGNDLLLRLVHVEEERDVVERLPARDSEETHL